MRFPLTSSCGKGGGQLFWPDNKVEVSESRKTETSIGGKTFSSHILYPRKIKLDLRGYNFIQVFYT